MRKNSIPMCAFWIIPTSFAPSPDGWMRRVNEKDNWVLLMFWFDFSYQWPVSLRLYCVFWWASQLVPVGWMRRVNEKGVWEGWMRRWQRTFWIWLTLQATTVAVCWASWRKSVWGVNEKDEWEEEIMRNLLECLLYQSFHHREWTIRQIQWSQETIWDLNEKGEWEGWMRSVNEKCEWELKWTSILTNRFLFLLCP